MFNPIIRTKFTKYAYMPNLAGILSNTSLVSHNCPNKSSLHLLHFFLHSSRTHLQEWNPQAILPFSTPRMISRTSARYSYASGHFSHASHLLEKMSLSKRQYSDYALLQDVFRVAQSVILEPNITNSGMVHALAVKQGALTDLCIATSLVTIYSRSKELGSSLALFGEVLDRDTVIWNAMMSACIENKCFQAATEYFKKMVGEGCRFDSTTLVIVISAISNMKNLGQGQIVHGFSVKAGMVSDTVLSNAVVDMYAKCGDLCSSECMFAGVECKDIVTWNSIIGGCFNNSYPEKSLWYFRRMAMTFCEDVQAANMSISCAMAACTALQEFGFGLAVHGWGIKLGYAENNYVSVGNSLISFYSKFHDIYAAACVFEGMVLKDVVSWNSMIKGFFLNGETVEAFRLLCDMQFKALIQADIATLLTLIPFSAELMLLREGKASHGFAVRRQMISELSIINSLINMYSRCNNVKEAEYLFSTLPVKDLVAWNTMIFGYAQNGKSWEAQILFKKMLGDHSTFTLPTLLAIIPSCDSPDSLQLGRSIHGWSIKLGFSNQIFAFNSLIHMYICCGDTSDAFALFERISIGGDVTSWNTIIVGCTQKGHFLEALVYFHLMRKASEVHCNSITLVSVISSCGNLGLPLQGKLIHNFALKTGLETDIQVQNALVTMYGRLGNTESARLAFTLSHDHNICSWNCVISALSQNEDAKKALELFRSLDFEPNEITISTVLSACTHLGAMTYGKQIHAHVFRHLLHLNPFISAALLNMYSNCGRLNIAEQVFLSSHEKSVAAWNSLISAYGFHNLGSKATETFQEMIKTGIHPTSSSFTSILSACSHAGLIDEGRKYYNHMFSKYNVEPTVEHHVCMVDMLGRSGLIREAYDFIKNLPTEAEAGIWGALLSACRYHGDLETGREVAEILFRVEPENVSYYVALCNMYIAAGRWEEAVELRNVIQDKQLRKPAGYSFIDVGLS